MRFTSLDPISFLASSPIDNEKVLTRVGDKKKGLESSTAVNDFDNFQKAKI